jgi:hypothetical protein
MPIGKIICIGDSLTAGDEGNAVGYRSYRGALQLLLQNAGYTVDFVGTQSSTPATGSNDPEHDGYGGARMDSDDSPSNSIEGRVAGIRTAVGAVDVIILFIGWNDVYSSTTSVVTKYSQLLATILAGTWASAKIVLVTLSPEPNKTAAQTGSDYPVYSQINTQIATSAAAAPTTRIVADLAALAGSAAADRDTMVEKLLYDAANPPDVTTRANGQGIPSVNGGHYITSFKSIQDYNANWRTTVPERRGVNGSTTQIAPDSSHRGHPYFVNSVNAAVPWLWVFAGPGHASVNTVVESRNLFAQAWRGSNNQWEFFFQGARPGATDANSGIWDPGHPDALRGFRPDGITSFYRTGGGTNIESWAGDTVPSRGISQFNGGTNRSLMVDAVCFCVGVQTRLALLDPNGPNDIQASRFVVSCGWDAYAGAPHRYDYWGWPYEAHDGGHDRWQILRATDWIWIGSITMDRGTGHFEDPGVPPPHEQGYPYAMPYNDYPTYSKSAAEIRANPPRLPQYYTSSSSSTASGWASADYWFNPGLGALDIHWSQQGADKAARVIYDRLIAAGWLATFVGGGPIDAQLLPGIAPIANWWPRFTTEATDPDTADWQLAGPVQNTAPAWGPADALPAATVGVAWTAQLAANGNPTPTYAHVSGKPAWMTIASNGEASGTPTGGATNHAIVVSASNFAGTVNKTLTLTVVVGASIITTTLPAAITGQAYSVFLEAAGNGPFTWSLTSGALPTGLSLVGSTITGTATGTTQTFTLRVDSPNGFATRVFTLTVAAPNSVLVITTTSLPQATAGVAYSTTLAATTTGAAPVWSIAAGALPQGFSLASATGVISGTTPSAGGFEITVQANNGIGTPPTRTFALNVAPAGAVALASPWTTWMKRR